MDKFEPEFPNNEEYWELCKLFPGEEMRIKIKSILDLDVDDIMLIRIPIEWVQALYNKIFSIELSYICAKYYYKLGFNGKEDLRRMPMFAYFASNGMFYIGTAYDEIAHIFQVMYDIHIKGNLYYSNILDKIKDKDQDTYDKLLQHKFNGSGIRNEIVHNMPPTEILGNIMQWKGCGIVAYGEHEKVYNKLKKPEEMMELLRDSIKDFQETINVLYEKKNNLLQASLHIK